MYAQDVKLTAAACLYLPAALQDHLVFACTSGRHRAADPRVLDVLLGRWRHERLCYHHHHQQQQQQHQGGGDEDDVTSLISLRESSLSVAVAFINAVRSGTLQHLRTLDLTSLYTGRPMTAWITTPLIEHHSLLVKGYRPNTYIRIGYIGGYSNIGKDGA